MLHKGFRSGTAGIGQVDSHRSKSSHDIRYSVPLFFAQSLSLSSRIAWQSLSWLWRPHMQSVISSDLCHGGNERLGHLRISHRRQIADLDHGTDDSRPPSLTPCGLFDHQAPALFIPFQTNVLTPQDLSGLVVQYLPSSKIAPKPSSFLEQS